MEEVHGVEERVVVLLLSTTRLLVLHVLFGISESTEYHAAVLAHTSVSWCWKEETKLLSLLKDMSVFAQQFPENFFISN